MRIFHSFFDAAQGSRSNVFRSLQPLCSRFVKPCPYSQPFFHPPGRNTPARPCQSAVSIQVIGQVAQPDFSFGPYNACAAYYQAAGTLGLDVENMLFICAAPADAAGGKPDMARVDTCFLGVLIYPSVRRLLPADPGLGTGRPILSAPLGTRRRWSVATTQKPLSGAGQGREQGGRRLGRGACSPFVRDSARPSEDFDA